MTSPAKSPCATGCSTPRATPASGTTKKNEKVIQQQKGLDALIRPYDAVNSGLSDVQTLIELSAEDPSVEGEVGTELERVEPLFDKFELMAMMSGKQDASNAIVSIKPGAGGTDACDWAETLYRMYTRWAAATTASASRNEDVEPNLEAGVQSVTFRVIGEYAYGYLQSEIGVHRLVRISPFGSGDTRQTSFAAVDVLPELDDTIEIVVNETELEMQTFCSGGPGGQHQNKTQSGVRLIHKSGVRAESRTERSQPKNYDNALKLLKARLYADRGAEAAGRRRQALRRQGRNRLRVSQIRSYVMQPYTLVRDERDGIDVKTPAVAKVLDGGIDEFMQAYLRHKTARAHKAGRS